MAEHGGTARKVPENVVTLTSLMTPEEQADALQAALSNGFETNDQVECLARKPGGDNLSEPIKVTHVIMVKPI